MKYGTPRASSVMVLGEASAVLSASEPTRTVPPVSVPCSPVPATRRTGPPGTPPRSSKTRRPRSSVHQTSPLCGSTAAKCGS